MHSISLIPAAKASARLVVALAGPEWLEFDVVLAPAMQIRFAPESGRFPVDGTVSIRRGRDVSAAGERITDSFRYIEACIDDETGEPVAERFGVTLFMEEAAFDRLTARPAWGLPSIDLLFDSASQVIAADASGASDALCFRRVPQPWERIASATLTQRLAD
jgi:hypothetical protein